MTAGAPEPVFAVRSIRVAPRDFERLYGEIATFLQCEAATMPGYLESQLFGSDDATRILIAVHWRSREDWSHAVWDARLGELLEEIVGCAKEHQFQLCRSDRFPAVAAV